MTTAVLEARLYCSVNAQGKPFAPTVARDRLVRDYEIDIECIGNRAYTYNGQSCTLARGDVLVRTPGGIVSSTGMQKTYILTLDFSDRPLPAVYSRNIPGELQLPTRNGLISGLPPVIHPRNPYALFDLYEKLIRTPVPASGGACELANEIIYLLNADLSHEKYKALKVSNSAIDRAMAYMEKHLAGKITLDELAAVVSLEKSYLIRLFRKETGTTPFQLLAAMRLDRACDLLATTEMKISEIATSTGYGSASFFISEYKKRFGVPPEAHRKNML